jgi:hypothetical protein
MEVQELAHQQERIGEGLKTLTKQLPELLAKVPPDTEYNTLRYDVNNFLKALDEAKVEPDLADAAKALGEPDTMTGYTLAQRAAEKMDKLVGKCNGMPKQGQQCLTARFKPKLSKAGMGNTLQQIMAAMNKGNQGQGDGQSMFNEDMGLYGPNVELAGEQGGARRDEEGGGNGQGRQISRVTGDAREPGATAPEGAGRVRLQPDAKFPLRYRDLVGEYFRSIAETETEKSK